MATSIGSWLNKILADTAAALTTPAGRVFLQPGEQAAWDECGDTGALWVAVAWMRPSTLVNVSEGCPPAAWDARVRVSVIRCVTGMDDRGRPPVPSALTADAHLSLTDMVEIRDAITPLGLLGLEWRPLGPEGGYAGGEWSATLQAVC